MRITIHLSFFFVLILAVYSQTEKKASSKILDAKSACQAKAPFLAARGYACNGVNSYVACDCNASFYAHRRCDSSSRCTKSGWLSHPPCGGKKETFPIVQNYEALCKSYAQADVYNGYVYLNGNTTHYLRCLSKVGRFHGVTKIHEMRACPASTKCHGPSGLFTNVLPCKNDETIRTIDESEVVNTTTPTLELVEDNAQSLCQEYTPTGAENENGYVCFESNSSRFLQCSNVSSTITNCASPLVCAYPIGQWITNNTPCDYAVVPSSSSSVTSSSSENSNEEEENPRELCDMYMPPSADNTGFVCLSPNSRRFL